MYLRNKKILVTGGGGFLGSFVLARLRQLGCERVLAPRSVQLDLSCQSAVDRYLTRERPEVILHLAARVGGIEANRRSPGTFLYHNLAMGTHLIESARLHDVEKFLLVGTICCYPKFTPVPFKEDDLWIGYPEETNAPYGLAKKLLMVQLQSYRQEFGFNGVNLLVVNLYGPCDNFDPEMSHVIPGLIRRCVEARDRGDKTLPVWGTGKPTREFLYAGDAARAICMAAETLDTSDPVNIGTGSEISIADLAHLIAKKVGFKGEIVFQTDRPDGQPRRCLDITRARELLGFEAATTLSEGLDHTIAWWVEQQKMKTKKAA